MGWMCAATAGGLLHPARYGTTARHIAQLTERRFSARPIHPTQYRPSQFGLWPRYMTDAHQVHQVASTSPLLYQYRRRPLEKHGMPERHAMVQLMTSVGHRSVR